MVIEPVHADRGFGAKTGSISSHHSLHGTARVQTVARDGSGIRQLLEAWYKETGCPMLLNTSLNIRGEPMVNDRTDADRFEQLYGVLVLS